MTSAPGAPFGIWDRRGTISAGWQKPSNKTQLRLTPKPETLAALGFQALYNR